MFSHIHTYMRHAASRRRVTERFGPFLTTLSPDNDNPYINYAIPDDDATPTPADVEALIAYYQANGRTPRLEYIPQAAPAVEASLMAYGFTNEGEIPLMRYDESATSEIAITDGIEFLTPHSDAELLGMITARHEAFSAIFASPPPDEIDIAAEQQQQHTFREAGGLSVFARDRMTGEAAGGGVCDVPFDHTTELAGIGVRPSFQRRGIAAAMTAWLVQRALQAGTDTIFLMAASPDVARIYHRAGFRLIGKMMHLSLK